MTFIAIPLPHVQLLPSLFQQRTEINRRYLLSLKTENLLQNFYLEAGLWSPPAQPRGIHWGWESPTSQVRGHFLGHWLSAAARLSAATQDPELKGKAEAVVAGLARCQRENGGEWVFSIPEKYLDWIARGKPAWAPHYTVHKTLMGLLDMAIYAGSEPALAIVEKAAGWFHRWSGRFSRAEFDDILDTETGGMLEAWADLYGLTRKPEHLELLNRYDRPRLFDRLLAGEDPLTNRHANTTIPEAHGAARAYEVTGEYRWRQIVEAYWRSAVVERGCFCTGSQTNGEIWTPPQAYSARLSDKNQEHCVVYNMVRLAEYLLRWTAAVSYADYMEHNLYNGTLAQQHPQSGMIAYFLPLQAGSQKHWGTPTDDFWCCHGTLVQAHTTHSAYIYYATAAGLAICQYIPSELRWEWQGVPVTLRQDFDTESSTSQPHMPDGAVFRPERWCINISVNCAAPTAFTLQLRLPDWLAGPAHLLVNGEASLVERDPSGYCLIERLWQSDTVRLEFPKTLTVYPLPDQPGQVAFLDGPVVLAGLCDEERLLYGDPANPTAMLAPDHEREWSLWKGGYRAAGQPHGLRFLPLYEITDERYTVYFPVKLQY